MGTRKSTTKKAAAKKPATKKAAAKKPAAKKSSARKPAAKRPSGKKAAAKKPAATKPKEKAGVSAADVNLGHLFSLRPRVSTSFRPDDFRTAKQSLQDESYPSIQEAARAVAETAMQITRDGPPKQGFRRPRDRR